MQKHKDILICAVDPEGSASIQVARIRLDKCDRSLSGAWLEAWDRGVVQRNVVDLLVSEGFEQVWLVDGCASVGLVAPCLFERMSAQMWVIPLNMHVPQHWSLSRQTA